jgi:hypothetical protein
MAEDWKNTQGTVHRFENPNDHIEGELVQVRDGNYFRPDGSKSKVYDIKTASGVETVFGSMILERLMGSIRVGQAVKIVYKGLVNTRSGRKAKAYEVYTK